MNQDALGILAVGPAVCRKLTTDIFPTKDRCSAEGLLANWEKWDDLIPPAPEGMNSLSSQIARKQWRRSWLKDPQNQ